MYIFGLLTIAFNVIVLQVRPYFL